jgi:glycosyltransferase involved in cell wall biosynthesis
MIYYMLAARPILAMALKDSDVATMVESAGCGWVVEPDQPHLLAVEISKVLDMSRGALHARGQAGRSYALERLTKEKCLPRVIDILKTMAAWRRVFPNACRAIHSQNAAE